MTEDGLKTLRQLTTVVINTIPQPLGAKDWPQLALGGSIRHTSVAEFIKGASPSAIEALLDERDHYDEETCNLASALRQAEAERDDLKEECEVHEARVARITALADRALDKWSARLDDLDSARIERDTLKAKVKRLQGILESHCELVHGEGPCE